MSKLGSYIVTGTGEVGVLFSLMSTFQEMGCNTGERLFKRCISQRGKKECPVTSFLTDVLDKGGQKNPV